MREQDIRPHNIFDRDEFDRKYRNWHATRAACYDPDLPEDDKSSDVRFDQHSAAQAALMIAPAPLPHNVFQKWELLDHLMTDEIVNGPFTVKDALIALASIKEDVMRLGLKNPE
jgi:hypothetical protein